MAIPGVPEVGLRRRGRESPCSHSGKLHRKGSHLVFCALGTPRARRSAPQETASGVRCRNAHSWEPRGRILSYDLPGGYARQCSMPRSPDCRGTCQRDPLLPQGRERVTPCLLAPGESRERRSAPQGTASAIRCRNVNSRPRSSGTRPCPSNAPESAPGEEPVDDPRVQAIATAAVDLVAKRNRWLNPEGNTGVASCLLTFRGAAPVDAVYRDRPLSERGEWGQVLLSDLSREVR